MMVYFIFLLVPSWTVVPKFQQIWLEYIYFVKLVWNYIIDRLKDQYFRSVVDWDDLIDPADEGGDLDVDAGHVLTAAPEAPADEAGQLVEALLVLAHQRTASVTLRDYIIIN